MTTLELFKKFCSSSSFYLLNVLIFLQTYIAHFAEKNFRKENASPQETAIFILIMLMSALLFGLMTKSLCLYRIGKYGGCHNKDSWSDFVFSRFGDWLVTEVRVLLRVILYTLFLIVPGIIESVRLSLAPLFVFYSKKMKDPYFDPIKSSREKITLNSPYFGAAFLFVVFLPFLASMSNLVLQFSLESLDGVIKSILLILTMSLTSIASFSFLISLYKNIYGKEQ